jgi:ribosomal protein S8
VASTSNSVAIQGVSSGVMIAAMSKAHTTGGEVLCMISPLDRCPFCA